MKETTNESADNRHLYEAQPDARQVLDANIKPTRFRPRYRQLEEGEKTLHDALKAKAEEMEALIMQVKGGEHTDYKMQAIMALELSVMWAVKDLTA